MKPTDLDIGDAAFRIVNVILLIHKVSNQQNG